MSLRNNLRRAYRGETSIDFIGRRRLWFLMSGAVIALCLASFVWRGATTGDPLNLGIEFKGGLQLTSPVPQDGPLGDVEDIEVVTTLEDLVEGQGIEESQVQVASGEEGRNVIVQTPALSEGARADLEQALEQELGVSDIPDSTEIGEKWGGEITNKALRGLVIFLVVVTAFISLRFEWKMALACLIAMIHDLILTAGVYSALGFRVTPASVIAILTILGYSLYDNVVVFDKVEEETTKFAATGRMTYQDAANRAMNEVFMRSLNTAVSTLLPVAALLVIGSGLFGATTLVDLSLALLVGLLASGYSSIFVATPFLAMLKEREPKYRNVRAKVLRDATRSAARPAAATAPAGADAPAEPAVVATAPTKPSRPTTTGPGKPKAGTKKAKRRKRR